jgi:hypothetical protein
MYAIYEMGFEKNSQQMSAAFTFFIFFHLFAPRFEFARRFVLKLAMSFHRCFGGLSLPVVSY